MLFFFIFIAFSFSQNRRRFQFFTIPRTTPEHPCKRRIYEIVPKPNHDHGPFAKYKVEQLSSNNMDEATVINTVWANPRAMAQRFFFGKPLGYNYSHPVGNKPEYIRVSVWDFNMTTMIANYSETVHVVYWDFRFYKINIDFQFRQGKPGEVFVTPIGVTDEDTRLLEETRIMFYRPYYSDLVTQDTRVGGDYYNWIPASKTFHWSFRRAPRIIYWCGRPYNGWDATHLGEGYPSQTNFFFAIYICTADGSWCPIIDPSFTGPTFRVDAIPGNVQFPILKHEISVIEGTPVWLPVVSSSMDYVDIELPYNMTIDARYPSYTFYRVQHDNTMSEHGSGYNFFRLRKSSPLATASWVNGVAFPVPFKFGYNVVYDVAVSMFIRIENGGWQEIRITPKRIPRIPMLPKRLITSFTWSSPIYYRDKHIYSQLGFNTMMGTYWIKPSKYDEYSPKSRSVWEVPLYYGPECSLFHQTASSLGLYSLFENVLEVYNVWSSILPSSYQGAARTVEINKWRNAILFWNNTGNVHRVNDIAYDGHFYRRHLEVLREFINATKPEHINFDIEAFSSKAVFVANIQHSQNAQNRRLSGETDEELHYRIVSEIFSDIDHAVHDYSPDTKITWYGTRCNANRGYQMADKWDMYIDKIKTICQPNLYIAHKHPEVLGHYMRASKQGCCYSGKYQDEFPEYYHKELIPMPTHGCWGEYPSEYTLSWLIQLFTNGATGFMLYPQFFVDDMDDVLNINDIIRAITPVEDMIMDGRIAYHELTDINNLAVGVIEHNGVYLIGISPFWNNRGGYFKIPFSPFFEVRDLRKNIILHRWRNIRYANGEIIVRFETKPEPMLILLYQINDRVVVSVLIAVFLVIIFFICLLLGVGLVFFFVFVKFTNVNNFEKNDLNLDDKVDGKDEEFIVE